MFDEDFVTGVRRVWHEDGDGIVTLETRHDVEPILDATKASMASVDERARYGELDRVASIPLTLFLELEKAGITRDPKAFKRWLNDPDHRAFRTRPGKI